MRLKAENVEIRGHEIKDSKKEDGGQFALVRFEDETGKAYELVDREKERWEFYKRGVVGDLFLDYVQGIRKDGTQWSKLSIIDFKVRAGA